MARICERAMGRYLLFFIGSHAVTVMLSLIFIVAKSKRYVTFIKHSWDLPQVPN